MRNKVEKKIGTSPTEYAEILGGQFISEKKKSDLSELGQYFTPGIIAKLMAGSFVKDFIFQSSTVRILDPGAGSGILCCALVEKIAEWDYPPKHIELLTYEIDKDLVPVLKRSLEYLRIWASDRKISLSFRIQNTDFVLENARILNDISQRSLFGISDFEKFDLIIANPPYFKISKFDPRAKAAAVIVHGQPNIYSLFMAIAASLLKEKGQLNFITPRSYASGLYFKKFRQIFFSTVIPFSIHIFESRDKAFNKDNVLQENIILHAKKDQSIDRQKHKVKISSCKGVIDIKYSKTSYLPLSEVLSVEDGYVLHVPTKIKDRKIVKLVRSWGNNLDSLGLEVSTGPIVPFRTRNILISMEEGNQTAPLFWLQNVKKMRINWPLNIRKPQYIRATNETRKLLVPKGNYVLIRRFSAKEESRRLIAAPLLSQELESELIGIENHLNYVYRRNGELSEIEAIGLSTILNSSLLDSYFRVFNGNTQVSATELRNMPLPDQEIIERIGLTVKDHSQNHQVISKEALNLIKQYA